MVKVSGIAARAKTGARTQSSAAKIGFLMARSYHFLPARRLSAETADAPEEIDWKFSIWIEIKLSTGFGKPLQSCR